MAQKSEIFVVAFKNAEGTVRYSGLDSRDSLAKSDNPMSFKHYFTHEQATALVRALRAKGLEEGTTVRAKSLAQSLRDYAWSLIQQSRTVELVDAETLDKVLKRYQPKDKPAEPETAEAPVTKEA